MTTEEKAKAYDEAIKAGRDILKDTTNEVGIALKRILPELNESEGEMIRKTLIDIVKRETGFTGFPSQGQVLAWLEKQKEQKPAEWSEEDETRLQQAITALESYSEWYLKEYRITRFRDVIAWLKSLRPHWKPSEVQIQALGEVAHSFLFTGQEHIISLYEDLKKLTEE